MEKDQKKTQIVQVGDLSPLQLKHSKPFPMDFPLPEPHELRDQNPATSTLLPLAALRASEKPKNKPRKPESSESSTSFRALTGQMSPAASEALHKVGASHLRCCSWNVDFKYIYIYIMYIYIYNVYIYNVYIYIWIYNLLNSCTFFQLGLNVSWAMTPKYSKMNYGSYATPWHSS